MDSIFIGARYRWISTPAVSFHCSADCLANRNSFGVKVNQTEDIDTVAIGRNALVVECIDATLFTKEMASGHRVKLVFGKALFASKEIEMIFWYLNHHCILEAADRTVTCR